MKTSTVSKLLCGVTIVLLGSISNVAIAASLTRASISTAGIEANAGSSTAAVSADGRYVAFSSSATNLVANDTNNRDDIFLRDRQSGTTVRVSVGSNGIEANGASAYPCISADGRYVGFESSASNLVAGDTNGSTDVFVFDTLTAATMRASIASGGIQANGPSNQCVLSSDGHYIAFNSLASNLVAGDTNLRVDIFVHDQIANTTERVSVSTAGVQGNNLTLVADTAAISADGRYVAFQSSATNLVAGDTNGAPDIFVRDRVAKTTTRVSLTNAGAQANGWSYSPSLSADGRYVAFRSGATNLVAGDTNANDDIFVRDRVGRTTKRVSVSSAGLQADSYSVSPSISADGRYIAFTSAATNLVAGDGNAVTDVFLRDMLAGTTALVSVGLGGAAADNYSSGSQISANGAYVLLTSGADDLVTGDTNGQWDVFVSGP
jgi:Tol biopolymer transport system component